MTEQNEEPQLFEWSVGMLTTPEQFHAFREELERLLETTYAHVPWQVGILEDVGDEPSMKDRYSDLWTEAEARNQHL